MPSHPRLTAGSRPATSAAWLIVVGLFVSAGSAQEPVRYRQEIAPLLSKYCAGCHNDTDREGDFSLSSLASLRSGTPEGSVLIEGKASDSKLLQVMLAGGEPQMPPEGEPAPSQEEIELIRRWIEEGARGDESQMDLPRQLSAPKLPAADDQYQYVGAACLVGSQTLAIGRLGQVELHDLNSDQNLWTASGLPGKVNCLRVSADGEYLVAGSGIAGLGGETSIIHVGSGRIVRRFQGHADTVYCASLSPDGKWLASGSYDRTAILWDAATGELIREFRGHNGAIYDLDFDRAGKVLATASADQTIKLWNAHTGQRLDTLGQPEGEMLCVRFSSDGRYVFGGGADRQIRKWEVISRDAPAINPMLVARYGHESAVFHLRLFGEDQIVSTSDDRTVKLWDTAQLQPLGQLTEIDDVPVALCTADEGEPPIRIIELRGRQHTIPRRMIDQMLKQRPGPVLEGTASQTAPRAASPVREATEFAEAEPNDDLADAAQVDLPASIQGVIDPGDAASEDVDLYRFSATAGSEWVFEVDAARSKSQLDSRIDILDETGSGVVRTRLQATRESYFTFRGKDSSTSDDFRLHKWEDMELDEHLYSSGEVTRLWLYPRGPDSGFKVYPGFGSRQTFFDTTPVSHALGEPAYIVRELGRNEQALPNGLPVFPIYYENDDDAMRRFGKDSRLVFVAPADGDYFLRIRDARGFGGPEFKYRIDVRRPQPDFSIAVSGNKMAMPVGSGREWKVTAKRIDGLTSPISIELHGLPEGFVATNPLVIEAGQTTALGTIYATTSASDSGESPDRPPAPPAKESGGGDDRPVKNEPIGDKPGNTEPTQSSEGAEQEAADANDESPTEIEVSLTARSEFEGREIVHQLKEKLKLSIGDATEVQLQLVEAGDGRQEITELAIRPGETVSARVIVQRNGTSSRIGFGKEDSGRNLPHGAYVDNIGLNGLLITEDQTEREFFITAAKKLKPGRRQFHLRSDTPGNPTSRPVWLHVLPANP